MPEKPRTGTTAEPTLGRKFSDWWDRTLYTPPPPPPRDVMKDWVPQTELVPKHWTNAAKVPLNYQTNIIPDSHRPFMGYGEDVATAYYDKPKTGLFGSYKPSRIQFMASYPRDWSKAYPHELAHAAWYEDLGTADKDKWGRIREPYASGFGDWLFNFVGMGSDLPYGAPSSLQGHYMTTEEGFAETYARYLTDPERLKREFPEGYKYFEGVTGKFRLKYPTKKQEPRIEPYEDGGVFQWNKFAPLKPIRPRTR